MVHSAQNSLAVNIIKYDGGIKGHWGLESRALGHLESGNCHVHSSQEEGEVLGERTEQRDNHGE